MWKGPYEDGITQSLLQKFIVCRHRFWLYTIKGYVPDVFDHKLEYGNLFHEGLETLAQGGSLDDCLKSIAAKGEALKILYSHKAEKIEFWTEIASRQFKLYIEKWQSEDQQKDYVLQEENFCEDYDLSQFYLNKPVKLRGKFDAGFLEDGKYILQENKTKGTVNSDTLMDTLHETLQVMFYMIAFRQRYPDACECLYNVVKRPLGDRYSIRQKKSESALDFIDRIDDNIRSSPDKFFKRWHIRLHRDDIFRFQRECFNSLLAQMCYWWESIKRNPDDPWNDYRYDPPQPNPQHWRRPFGVFDGQLFNLKGEYYEYIVHGSDVGLKRIETPFPELEE